MNLNRKWLHEEFVDLSSVSDKEYVETLTVFGQNQNLFPGQLLPLQSFPMGFVNLAVAVHHSVRRLQTETPEGLAYRQPLCLVKV